MHGSDGCDNDQYSQADNTPCGYFETHEVGINNKERDGRDRKSKTKYHSLEYVDLPGSKEAARDPVSWYVEDEDSSKGSANRIDPY